MLNNIFFRRKIESLPSVDILINKLFSRRKKVRLDAVIKLGNIRNSEAISALFIAFESQHKEVRTQSLDILRTICSTKAIELLLNLINSNDKVVARNSIYLLGNIRDPRAIGSLIDNLLYEQENTRMALLEYGDTIIGPLALKLVDPNIVFNYPQDNIDILFRKYIVEVLDCTPWKPERSPREHAWYFYSKREWTKLIRLGKYAIEPFINSLKYSDSENDINIAVGFLENIKWKPTNNVEKCFYRLAKMQFQSSHFEEWHKIEELGKEAIRPLLQKISQTYTFWDYHDHSSFQEPYFERLNWGHSCVECLEHLLSNKEFEYVEPLKRFYFNFRAAGPDTLIYKIRIIKCLEKIGGEEVADFLIEEIRNFPVRKHMNEDFLLAAIKSIGNIRIQKTSSFLVELLENRCFHDTDDIENALVETIGCQGDKRAADKIIDYLIEHPRKHIYEIKKYYDALRNTFEDYTDLIVRSLGYVYETRIVELESGSRYTDYKYDLEEGNRAIEELRNISSGISTNILIKVLHKVDRKDCKETRDDQILEWEYLSFLYQRQLAKEEIEKRGNPSYDSSVYMKEDWKILKKERVEDEDIE